MTHTIQPRSVALITKKENAQLSSTEANEGKTPDIQKLKVVLDHLVSLSDNLDDLYATLKKLNSLAGKYSKRR